MRNIIFASIILATTVMCSSPNFEPKNRNNFTLSGSGYTGMYRGFEVPYEKQWAVRKVADKWGIKLKSMGCVLNEDSLKIQNSNNREAEANIRNKYGSDWLEKFMADVDKEYNTITPY